MGNTKVTKVRINSKTVVDILKSGPVRGDLKGRGAGIQSSLPTSKGEEWTLSSFTGKDRVHVVIKTGNHAARETAAETSAMQSALGAGR